MPNLRSKARTAAKAILPKSLVSFIQGCRYRGYLAHISYVRKLRRYRTQFAEANRNAQEPAIVLPGGCRILIPPDPVIRDAFEHFGWKDPEMVDEFIGFMKLTADAKVLWDVGALFGFFSLAFTLRDPGRRAVAFEPNPISRAKLGECLRLNPGAKIEVMDCAVGSPGKVVEFARGFHFIAVAEPAGERDAGDAAQGDTVSLETISIDELIDRDFAAPDVIKIDVEGHEFEVLQGARKLLLAKRPLLSIELHPDLLALKGTSAVAIAEYLEGAGYAFYDTDLKRVNQNFFKHQNNFRVVAR